MELHIKNMVCDRCKKVVADILQQAGVSTTDIQLGIVKLAEPLTPAQDATIRRRLQEEGFELLEEQKARLVEQIKQAIIERVHYNDQDDIKENLSVYLAHRLHRDYSYLSNLFSAAENITIEQYFILQKIEKAKELLVYGEMTLSEIAWKLQYSSVAHLSTQFKRITGFTPSSFRKLKEHHRKPLDKV